MGYIVSAQVVRIEGERIEAVQNWPEPKSVRDIQVFLGFVNFYWRFIQGFSKIAGPLTSMLRTENNSSKNLLASVNVAEGNGVVGGDAFSRKIMKLKIFLF